MLDNLNAALAPLHDLMLVALAVALVLVLLDRLEVIELSSKPASGFAAKRGLVPGSRGV